jgi:hypothetical protein
MATALNILIVHGIGWGGRAKTYARPLEDNIRAEFDRAIRRLHLRDVKDTRAKNALRFDAACWDPVTQKPQDSLLQVMFGKRRVFGKLNLTYQMRRNMIGLLGDVTCYECDSDNHVYQAIHREVDQSMDALSEASLNERNSNGYAPLSIIGHSLGSVIGSDYVWDHSRSSRQTHYIDSHHFILTNMFTMGSPMAIYSLRTNAYGDRDSIRESLDSPIHVEPEHGLWLNLYDNQDSIGFPLEPIESYKAVGVIDRVVNAGNWMTNWNLGSHVGYWRSEEVARLIARKLALDWARLNSPRFAERDYKKALADFRKELRKV